MKIIPRDKRRFYAVLAALIAAAALIGWWFWPKHAATPVAASMPVNAGHPVTQDFPIRVTATGSVLALNTVDVTVRGDG